MRTKRPGSLWFLGGNTWRSTIEHCGFAPTGITVLDSMALETRTLIRLTEFMNVNYDRTVSADSLGL
jgi:hypothetical protein